VLPLSVAVALNREAVEPGDVLQVGMSATNPGPSTVVDLYLVAVLPPAAGPALGCPNHDPIVFAAAGGARLELACVSDPPQTFPPYIEGLSISAGQTVTLRALNLVWPAEAPLGSWAVALFAVRPDSLGDGGIDDEDILASAFDTLGVGP
jgi:hypothetical protein